MQFPFEIFDHIFRSLKYDSDSLIACSTAHPIFSQIVERYLYYHVVFPNSAKSFVHHDGYFLAPSHLIQIVSGSPQIVDHVRLLQIVFTRAREMAQILKEVALILPKFHALECLILTRPPSASTRFSWQTELPLSFKTAVEDCLRLPTLQRIYVGDLQFPLSILDNNDHINCVSLHTPSEIPGGLDNPYPQLKSLSVVNGSLSIFGNWAKRHIGRLESLQCELFDDSTRNVQVLELFEICSDTLNDLSLLLRHKAPSYAWEPRPMVPTLNLSFLANLKYLTIRMNGDLLARADDDEDELCTWLPEAVKIVKTVSSLQYLTIDIVVESFNIKTLQEIDLSPLAALAESSASLRHIDLYIYAHPVFPSKVVRLLMLERHESLKKLIEQQVMVIHTQSPENVPRLDHFVF